MILGLLNRIGPGYAQQIGFCAAGAANKKSLWRNWRQPPERMRITTRAYFNFHRSRQESAHNAAGRGVMWPEHAERITQGATGKCFCQIAWQGWQIHHVVHESGPTVCSVSRANPCSGTSIQVGRFAAS